MKHSFFAGLCLLAASTTCQADMYLMVRGKVDGTDLIGVSFLRDKRMPDGASCETERRAARTTGFQIFSRAHVPTHRGFTSSLQTYCLESPQQIEFLQSASKAGPGFMYMVEARDGRLKLTPYDSMGKCVAVAGGGDKQSEARFCARSTQRLLN